MVILGKGILFNFLILVSHRLPINGWLEPHKNESSLASPIVIKSEKEF